jgi:hypothetical protein
MTKMVDSKQEELSISEIITQAVYNTPTEGVPPYAAILSIIKEGSMPNTTVEQYGNTVFITHFSEDKDLAVGRALNIDVARNFIYNGEAYFRDLVRNGTRKFVAQFDQASFARAFMQFKRKPITTDMRMYMYKLSNGGLQIRIALDGDLTEETKQ